uniref:Uncharacterized protein n=1 Tax=Arundo donax TaxID=35708 RepID=A0A0A9D117_ARUDO
MQTEGNPMNKIEAAGSRHPLTLEGRGRKSALTGTPTHSGRVGGSEVTAAWRVRCLGRGSAASVVAREWRHGGRGGQGAGPRRACWRGHSGAANTLSRGRRGRGLDVRARRRGRMEEWARRRGDGTGWTRWQKSATGSTRRQGGATVWRPSHGGAAS